MPIKITVIIPSYRPQEYLWECLDSLCNQSFPKEAFEVIIILNGCKDPYYGQINDYVQRHSEMNLHCLQTDMGGVSNARNIGIENAKGDYICFVDDDDFVSSTYLEELYEHATPKNVSLCYPLSFVDGSKEFKTYHITHDYLKNKANSPCDYRRARRFFSGPVYKLIHRDIIGDRRFLASLKNGEDSVFMFEISNKLNLVDFTDMSAVYYRRIRQGSALLRKKNSSEIWGNCGKMIVAYSRIYFSHPFCYSFNFYFTRLLGAIHAAIEQYQLRKM